MSLVLKSNQACPHANSCPHNNAGDGYCHGANPNRGREFVCDLVTEQGSFIQGGFRSKYDETGKMKILVE